MEQEIDYLDILIIILSAFVLQYLLPLYLYTKSKEKENGQENI